MKHSFLRLPFSHCAAWLFALGTLLLAAAPAGATPQFLSLHSFSALAANGTNADGANPTYGALLASGGACFGTTSSGGANGTGSIYSIAPDGTETTFYSFPSLNANGVNAGGASPVGTLVQSGSYAFGVCAKGGANGFGTVFQLGYSPNAPASVTTLVNFTGTTGTALGSFPVALSPDGYSFGITNNFYGVTSQGGTSDMGTVFMVPSDGGAVKTLVNFTGANGADPEGGLLYDATSGDFFGTTAGGGSSHGGTVFQMTPTGTLTTLVNFNGANGVGPAATLLQGQNGNFYGTTEAGGANGTGSIFQMTPSGALTTVYGFSPLSGGTENPDGANPTDALVQGLDGDFYGTARNGGALGNGTLFKVTPVGALTTFIAFTGVSGAYPGASPYGGLTFGSDGNFYGTTEAGGANGTGTVFSLPVQSKTLYSFTASSGSPATNSDGANPSLGNLTLGRDGNFYGAATRGGSAGNGTIFKITPAGTLTTLHSFAALSNSTYGTNSDGAFPNGGLVQGADGNFYGTAGGGGTSGDGVVFKITTTGTLTILADFDGNNGSSPDAGLALGSDGNFYGLAGSSIFQVTPGGSLTVLAYLDAGLSKAALVQGPDGNLYGTTFNGGSTANPNNPEAGDGSVFEVVLTSPYSPYVTTLVSFMGSNGIHPICTPLFGNDGNLYGTTQTGGVDGAGTVFKVTPSGTLTTIATFPYNGPNPVAIDAGVVFGNDGNLYGTTQVGGSSDDGSVYRVTPPGALTTLLNFSGINGADPYAGLTLGTDGNFYGTTNQGGSNGTGTVYQVTGSPFGSAKSKTTTENAPITFTVAFTDPSGLGVDGIASPAPPAHGTLTVGAITETGTTGTVTLTYTPTANYVGTDSFTYTVTGYTGTSSPQTVTLTIVVPPLPTITSFTPTSGPVGTVVTVTGTNLNGVTAVRFHNANATAFSANAAGTQLTATVPSGAGTGTFTVTTPAGSVKTTGMFTIIPPPTITSFTPTSGPVGTVVTVTGTNFGGVTRVRFHNASAVTYSVNAQGTQITVTVPMGAGTGTITVDTPGGGVTSAATFTVLPPPTITSFTPTSGPIGTVVTITGTHLNGVTAVRFHNSSATVFSANGAGTQLTVTVPKGAATGTITVTTPGGSVKTATPFTVN